MSSKIVLKKSSVGGKVPLTTDLEYGELALNYTDKKLYFKTATNEIDFIAKTDLNVANSIDRQYYLVTSPGENTFNCQYEIGYVDVYVNGVKLNETEFTATSGTTVTLTGLVVNDEVQLVGFRNINIADLLKYSLKTSNYTLSAKEGIITDTSGGSFTVSLPPSPTIGDQVFIADTGNWGTNPLTVNRNGSTIEGNADNLSLDLNNALVQFLYDGTTWQVFSQIGGDAAGFLKLTGGTMTGAITFDASQTWPTFNQNTTGNAATATTATNVSGGTASVTTLTTSSTVTHNGGTANGVAYLNGSKVLTTGSALTFDGSQLDIPAGTAAAPSLSTPDDPDTGVYFPAANQLAASVGGTEGLRLTSTGLGIGTSSPGAKLDVQGDVENQLRLTRTTTTTGAVYSRFTNGGGNYYIGVDTSVGYRILTDSTPYALCIASESARPIFFGTNNTLRAQIDSSGNLGLGVTPTASWGTTGSAYKVFQYGVSGFLAGRTGNETALLGSGAYHDGTNWRYLLSGNFASLYQQASGLHAWYTAPSGTAGNAISFTQAMTLDASGNLGVGTSSIVADTRIDARLDNSGSTSWIRIQNQSATANSKAGFKASTANGDWQLYANRSGGFYIDTPSVASAVNIDNSGNLLVGSSTFQGNTPRLYVTKSSQGNSGNNIIWVNDSAATASAAMHVWSFSQATAPTATFVDAYYNGIATLAFRIAGNGNVTNINNSYGAISDAKLKENIVDATPKLEKLNQVRVVNFNMIGDQQKQLGVIAQELEQIFPGMVEESPDRDAEGNDLGTTTKSVKYSVFVPMLIKAIQEQQAIIEQLKADVAILKGAA